MSHSYLLQIEIDTAIRVCGFVLGGNSQNGEAGVPFQGVVDECLRGRARSLNGVVEIHSHARVLWPFMLGERAFWRFTQGAIILFMYGRHDNEWVGPKQFRAKKVKYLLSQKKSAAH